MPQRASAAADSDSLDDTSRQCIWMMLALLMYQENSGGTDFLMVQAAGNGEDNKGLNPADAWNGSFFTRITDTLFWSCVTEGSVNGFTYQDIEERILIVGAAENTRDGDGNYQMATFSNFGRTVDICAPGEQIYTAEPGGYVEDSRGTSLAASLVTGSGEHLVPRERLTGLSDTLFSSSIQFARGTSGSSASLYLDYYFNFNSQGVSTIRLRYNGQLEIAGGVDCSEFAYQASCDTGASEGSLETTGGRQLGMGGSRAGWRECYRCSRSC